MSPEKPSTVKAGFNPALVKNAASTLPKSTVFTWRYLAFLLIIGPGVTLSMALITMNLMAHGRSGIVPNVVGKPTAQAAISLAHSGFILRKTGESFSETIPVNCIVSQIPVAGESLKKGRWVQVVVSSGQALAQVPELEEQTLSEAQIALSTGRLSLGQVIRIPSDDVAAGRVVAQSVPAGMLRNRGAVVDLLVSNGPQARAFLTPDFKAKTWPEIYSLLSQYKILLGQVTVDRRGDVPKQTILAQEPEPGDKLSEGGSISFTVAGPVDKGPANFVPVPFHVPESGKQKSVRIVVIDDKGSREIFNDMAVAGSDIAPSAGLYGQCLAQYFVNNELVQEKWLQ